MDAEYEPLFFSATHVSAGGAIRRFARHALLWCSTYSPREFNFGAGRLSMHHIYNTLDRTTSARLIVSQASMESVQFLPAKVDPLSNSIVTTRVYSLEVSILLPKVVSTTSVLRATSFFSRLQCVSASHKAAIFRLLFRPYKACSTSSKKTSLLQHIFIYPSSRQTETLFWTMLLTTIFQIFKKPFNDALNAVGMVQPTVFPGASFRCNSSTETLCTANSSVQDISTQLPHDVPEAVKVQPPMSNVVREDANSQYCGSHETMGQINHSTPQSTSQPSRDPLIGASSVAQIQSPAVTQEAESHGRFVEETLEQIRKLTASNASIERSFTNVAGRLKRVVREHSPHMDADMDAEFRRDFEYLRDDWDSYYEVILDYVHSYTH